jgi:uncharacterized protein (TIGR00369 family)
MDDRDALLQRYADDFNRSGLLHPFGARLSFAPGARRSIISVDQVLPVMRGGLGTAAVNGGVLAALFDVALGTAASLLDPLRATATVQLSMRFERPVTGDSLRCEGWVEQGGKSLVFTAAHVLDAAGEICARAEGVVRVSQKPWAKGASPGSALET